MSSLGGRLWEMVASDSLHHIGSKFCLISIRCLLSNFRSIIRPLVAKGRLKTKDNVKVLALKVVVAAYKRF